MQASRGYAAFAPRRVAAFRINESKPAIDEIDHALARHYGFTEEEMDIIINCGIKYRMGRDADEEGSD
ncbi:MAG: hypothetical protein HYV27_16175 [Candidatus Hydrogenedentes bacterium]|nr:hypothetical protein [Candidatus Hydrogenedentota bacterium]